MLVLSRKKNESIIINDDITIVVVETCGNDVCLSTCVKLSEFFGVPITQIWTKP